MKLRVIYKILNIKNNKYYLGSTINYQKRKNAHLYHLRKGTHHSQILQRAFDKYGEENFKFIIIKKFDINIHESIIRKEEQYILDNNPPPYNISGSASGGYLIKHHPNREKLIKNATKIITNYTQSEKGRREISERTKGENNPNYKNSRVRCPICDKLLGYNPVKTSCSDCRIRTGENNPFYGKKHTDKTIEKIKKANTGKLPPNTRPVVINGIEYHSATEAAKKLNVVAATILNRVRNEKFPEYKFKD